MPAFRGPDGRVIYVTDEDAPRYSSSRDYQQVGDVEAGAGQNRVAHEDNGVLGSIGATVSAGLSGATLGASDWLLKGVLDKGQFEQLAQDRADNPTLAGAAQAAGMMLPALVSGGAATPAGALGKLAAEGIEAGRATGGALGVAQQLGAAGAEGAIANAGIYLSDVALGDRDLTAEGINGALGTGLLFGAAGIPVSHGIEAGTVAARRMFARYSQGGAQAAADATAAWTEQAQRHLGAFDQAADLAKARLAETQTAREAANLQRLRAGAEMADARAFTPAQEFPGAPGEAASSARPAAPGEPVPGEPPEIAGARVLRDRAVALAGQPITPEEIAALEAKIGKRTYSSRGAGTPPPEPPPAGNALEQLAQQPGVVTHGPDTAVREFGARAVPVTADEAELGARLAEYQDARRAFADLHAQVDPDLDVLLGQLGGRAPGRPDLETAMQRALGHDAVVGSGGVPIGEFGAPGAGGFKSQETLARLAAGTGAEEGAQVAELASADATGAGGPRALRSQGTPPARSLGEVAAEQSPVPVEQGTAVGRRPAGNVPEGFDLHAQSSGDQVFSKNPTVHTGIPEFGSLSRETFRDNAYIVRPSELESPRLRGITSGEDMVADARTAKVREAWKGGERVPALEIDVDSQGHYFVADGNHRLLAAAADGDRPVLARFRPVEAEVGNMDRIGDDLARALGRKPASAAGDDLLAALSGTKGAIDKGAELADIGGKEAAATRAEQLSRRPETAERFLRKAGASDAADAVRAKASGSEHDAFFRDLTAPKTRDAYVAANIGRAMREEGSHAAALAKVEREWTERSATEAWAERAAILEYEGGYSRAEAERIARDEVESVSHGPGAESPPVWESKKNLKRTEAAKKAAAASVERLHEIHSAVASNLPQELQTAWNEEGYKFLRQEAARVRGVKDRINAASKISEAFTEQYGSGSETLRGYEGDRYHRRAEIEAKHAESWASEQERKHYARMAGSEGHPLDVKRLEMAHDAAIERAATATEPGERAAAAQEAKAIEKQITQVGARPGAVEDVAALAPAVTRVEKAAAALTEALGDAAPAAAKEHAAAFRAAEDNASRKTTARIGQAADDAAAAGSAARNRDPLAPPARAAGDDLVLGPSQKQQRIAAAQKAQREAGAAYAKARVAEAEAQIGAKQAAGAAAEARAKLGPPPEATPARGAGAGHRIVQGAHVVGFAADLASDVGIPGIPRPHDIPVIGPLLSAYLKYRAFRAAAGRFMGRVPATAETHAAELAARTRDSMARAVDRSLGLIERNTNTVRTALTIGTLKATDALGKRLIDDGQPDAKEGASLQEQAAVRMREIAAAATNPALITQAVRAQGRTLVDPDLIDALSNHLMSMFQYLNSVAPKGPPPNPYTGKQWTPSQADAVRFGQQVAIAKDPQVAFQMLDAGTLTPAGAATLQNCYRLLFQEGQQRIMQRAAELKSPVAYPELLRLGRLFDVPLHPSLEPENAAALAVAHTPAAKPAPAASGPGTPTPSIANPTNISSLYDAGGARRAGRT